MVSLYKLGTNQEISVPLLVVVVVPEFVVIDPGTNVNPLSTLFETSDCPGSCVAAGTNLPKI